MERRKGKNTPEEIQKMLEDVSYFGTMLVYMGKADGMVSGAVHSTGATVRPALQIIKTKPGAHRISGAFLLTLSKELVDQIENKDQLRELILELRKINIEELSRRDDQWRDRLDAEKQAHSEDIRHLTEAHNAQLERLQRVYADQMAELTSASLGVHQKESDHIQQTAQMQYESLQKIAETQKDADERAKAYLKRQVRTWKIISFLLVFTLILLLVVDLRNPDKGWIKFIGSKLFSMRGFA